MILDREDMEIVEKIKNVAATVNANEKFEIYSGIGGGRIDKWFLLKVGKKAVEGYYSYFWKENTIDYVADSFLKYATDAKHIIEKYKQSFPDMELIYSSGTATVKIGSFCRWHGKRCVEGDITDGQYEARGISVIKSRGAYQTIGKPVDKSEIVAQNIRRRLREYPVCKNGGTVSTKLNDNGEVWWKCSCCGEDL